MTAPAADTLLIASWIEPELVEHIRECAGEIRVVYEPDLLRPPRYAADHTGQECERSEDDEARWRALLAEATILFDFDITHRQDLPDLAPNVRWVQATSAGIGPFVRRLGYDTRMPDAVFTTASGVHARPLAEFAIMSMLAHSRRLLHTVAQQRAHHWERFAGTELNGRTVVVVGHGSIGREVGRFSQVFGLRVIGVKRTVEGVEPASAYADQLMGSEALHTVLPQADFLVLAAPHTDATESMIGAPEFTALPPGSVVINIGRGALIDEAALIDALQSGHVGGAYLDVFAEEPLPAESPLWDMPNVLVCPHSASTSDGENARIVHLFCENLKRWQDGRELLNVLDTEQLY